MDNLKEEQEAGNPNPQQEDVTPEKRERYLQQIEGGKKEVERLKTFAKEVAKAAQDSHSLVELYNKDPNMANEVAKEYGYSSFDDEELQKKLFPNKEIKSLTEDDFEKMYQQRKLKEEHDRSLKKVEKIISKLPEELQDKAKTYFDKISSGKMLDEETALEFADMATLYVNKDKLKSDKQSDGLAILGSTGISNTKKGGDNEPEYVVRDGKLILLTK